MSNVGGGFSSDQVGAKRRRVQLSPPKQFVEELSKHASDSQDSDHADRDSGADPHSQPNAVEHGSSNFFEQASENDKESEARAGKPTALRGLGVSLLRRMHAEILSDTALNSDKTRKSSKTDDKPHSTAFNVIETYSPLTTGGFFDTSEEFTDVRALKTGDIMSLLFIPPADAGASQGKRSPHRSAAPNETLSSPKAVAPAVQPGRVVEKAGSKASLASPLSIPPSEPRSLVVDPAQAGAVLQQFTSELDLTEEERLLGKNVSVEMLRRLFEVTRLDRHAQRLEGLFVDGSRRILHSYQVRRAGYVERKLYQQWKADPSSRPVHRIEAPEFTQPSIQTRELANPVLTREKAKSDGKASLESGAAEPGSGDAQASPSASILESTAAPVAWWVIPNLIVRIVAENAGEWYNKKCVVRSIDRKQSKVRLMRLDAWLRRPTKSSELPTTQGSESVVEVVGLGGLETVLPKKGESGLVVLGEHRGEVASVLSRQCTPEGDLIKLKVQCNRTGDIFELEPSELCLLAPRL